MKRALLVLMVLLMIPAFVQAKDMTGKWGLGYFMTDAPVGIRYWFGETAGLDVGVGFQLEDVIFDDGTGPSKETATDFYIEAGVPVVVFPSERANFFVRPGVLFGSLDGKGFGTVDETYSLIVLSGTLGAEVFFGEHFSLEAGHGIKAEIFSPPDAVSTESFTTISSFGADITYLGFHFYFK